MTITRQLREIPGWPGYWAGSDGTIWSTFPGCGGRYTDVHPLAPHKDKYGYMRTSLGFYEARKTIPVHKLVALAFIGLRPEGMVICHRNGKKTDNRAENLSYGTAEENVEQKKAHGTFLSGERGPAAKLTDSQCRRMLRLLKAGHAQTAVAKQLGVGVSTVWAIKTGRSRPYLTAEAAVA